MVLTVEAMLPANGQHLLQGLHAASPEGRIVRAGPGDAVDAHQPLDVLHHGIFMFLQPRAWGVSDNKGPAIGILYVMECLRELKVPLKHELCLFVGTDAAPHCPKTMPRPCRESCCWHCRP